MQLGGLVVAGPLLRVEAPCQVLRLTSDVSVRLGRHCHPSRRGHAPQIVRAGTGGDRKEQDLDPIEKLVGAIFGKKALEDREPMGLKRLNFDQLPDQKVVLDLSGKAVEGDTPEMALIRPLLAGTQLDGKPLRLAYDAAEHGWSYRAFHDRVDGFGAALVLASTEGGAVIGGYNPEGWISLGEDRDSNGAFLFCWADGDISNPPIKLPKVGGPSMAVIDKAEAGPQFGAEGLSIPLKPIDGEERKAKSRLGTFYEKLPDGSRTLFSEDDDRVAQLSSLKVFVVVGDGVKWELDGIIWKSSL